MVLVSPNDLSGTDQAQRGEDSPPPDAKVEGTPHYRPGDVARMASARCAGESSGSRKWISVSPLASITKYCFSSEEL